MSFILEKRVNVDEETVERAMHFYETPPQFYEAARLMVTDEELVLIANMGMKVCTVDEIKKIIADNNLADDAEGFIDSAWRRYIINKVKEEGADEVKYQIATFYARYPIFAQYEQKMYRTLPKPVIDALNDWDFEVYFAMHRKTVLDKMKGIGLNVRIHQSDFMPLEEALLAIDETENQITIVPCNCKTMTHYQHKPTDVCINLGKSDPLNSQQARGYGKKVTKEEAKELISQCSKDGLMHCGEYEHYCNCDGVCCYPLRMARELGSRGVYPRAHYQIEFHESECDHCGKCADICNFNAFAYDAYGKVVFHPERCYGCTICSANCPLKAIHLKKIDATPIPGSKAALAMQK